MPNGRQLRNARYSAVVLEAGAGLIPASDADDDEIRARINRTDRVAKTVKAYAKLPWSGCEGIAITEVLADLRHYCEDKGLAFRELDVAARALYLEEVEFEKTRSSSAALRPQR
jgi:hypothetical protein